MPLLASRLQHHTAVQVRDDQEERTKFGRERGGDARCAEQGTAGVGEAGFHCQQLGQSQV